MDSYNLAVALSVMCAMEEEVSINPKNLAQTDDERLCFERGMDQWRASLKRPDMTEEDRVKGALQAYERQAFALKMMEDLT